jgi:hypothetical protein
MSTSQRPKLTYANVIATIALFVGLGGAAVAAGLPKHSVGAKQLKRGAVTSAALRRGAVTSPKLAPKAVITGKLGPSAVLPGNIVDGGITTPKLAANAVIASKIKNGVITTNKLANEAVTAAKLSKDVAPLLGTLKSGQTLRGAFDVGSNTAAANELTRGAVSFQFPLLAAPAVTILQPGQTSANCAGLGGGNAQTPQATAGNLCVYITEKAKLDATTPLAVENNTRLGFGLVAKSDAAGTYFAYGQWAVTAP